jgi:hypothetical protein
MTEVRRADPAAKRQALVFVILGAFAGAVLMIGFERYRIPLRDWVLSEPGKFGFRLRLVFLVTGVLLSVPLVTFAIYLWALGARVLRAQQFPPPGYRVIRDTPVVEGQAAIFRGRGLKVLALCLGMVAVLLWLLFGRLEWVI